MILSLSILTLTVIVYVIYCAIGDNNKIKAGEKINHTLNAIQTIIWAVTCSCLIIGNLYGATYFLSVYWLLFDLLLNKLRGKDLLFVGTTAWLDKSFRKIFPQNPGMEMLICKIICLMVSIGLLLIKL